MLIRIKIPKLIGAAHGAIEDVRDLVGCWSAVGLHLTSGLAGDLDSISIALLNRGLHIGGEGLDWCSAIYPAQPRVSHGTDIAWSSDDKIVCHQYVSPTK